ncbi:MAG: glycosyltransferase family 25 protein [Shimia sp.]|uniref:glycosyltransferase family 25 protein n=1 Tax=Shimia sp. TaxID=1954381 RepID=UPI003B8CB17F
MSKPPDNLGIWLINLPKDSERLANMQSQLATMGLTAQVFEAINGKERAVELASNVNEQAYLKNTGQPIIPGHVGVYASHKAVWDLFLASDKEFALIFEDDVVFHDDFRQALETGLAAHRHWDLLRFNAIRAKLPVPQGLLGKYTLNAYIGPFTGNAAYLLNRHAAQKFCEQIWPQTRPLDHEMNRFDKYDYRALGLEPFASHPDDGGVSTITGVGFDQVRKPHWSKRVPYYRLKITNYFRRANWLLKAGMVPGSKKPLDKNS